MGALVKLEKVKEAGSFLGTIGRYHGQAALAAAPGEGKKLASIDDILNRAPMDTLKEAFLIRHNAAMSEQQEAMLQDLLNGIKNETTD